VTFVQKPGVLDGNPHPIHFFEGQPQSLDRAFQNRGEGEVEHIAFAVKEASGGTRLFDALR